MPARGILLILLLSGAWMLASCSRQSSDRLPDVVEYNFHIRPIISDRCFKCHGPDARQRKANLRLDTEDGLYAALKDNPDGRVIVPGEPDHSELYRRIVSADTAEVMPPPTSRLSLSDREVKLIGKWISQGAKYQKHWAFIPPKPAKVPKINSNDWARNEIDHFILEKLEEHGLSPSKEAYKEALLKRVSFDLTGLPPSLQRQQSFLKNDSPDAYEKIVDSLLTDSHYGERMALPWLDVARYADSHGYQDDGLRTMWPWRDWVIHAFNENYPFDKFVMWQLAGDLLPNPSREMLLATGFNRNHKITQEGGVIDEEYRVEYVTDRTNTFGKAFLALTLECAKCHDHKYDPISQKDYFSTFAFFNQVPEKGLVGDIMLNSMADPPKMYITKEDTDGILNFINKKQQFPVEVMIMKDSSVVRPTYVLVRGAYDNHGEMVHKGVPAAVLPFDTTAYPANRLGLAQWLLSKDNPLTARVFVNRTWQEFFGRGIVKTAGDFGMQGDLPSHPQLLDWLALDFMNNGWNIKRLVKQIVMSATYRQSASATNPAKEIDPENIWLSHAPRVRLTSEAIKDLILSSSGLLVDEIGGPSVKPYQPPGIWEASTSGRGLSHYIQDHDDKLYRRGMYNFIKRTVPPPSMLMFDASSRDQCEVRRLRTNTPLQALVMLNDPMVLEGARVLAERLMKENAPQDQRIEEAFRIILCRYPNSKEKSALGAYYDSEVKRFREHQDMATAFLQAGEYKHEQVNEVPETAALMQVIHTVYNLDEAITK